MTAQPNLNTLIKETLEATQAFRKITEAETESLQQAQFQQAADLAKTKKEALERYQTAITHLTPFQDQLKNSPQHIKDAFQEEKILFDKAVSENKKVLEKSGYTTRRLFDRVLSVAKQALNEKSLNYTQKGLMQQQPQTRPLYMSINETF